MRVNLGLLFVRLDTHGEEQNMALKGNAQSNAK